MIKEIIKNPVIIGLIAGSIVYAYLSWDRKKRNEKRLKRGKKIKSDDKYDDIIIPIITAVLFWFIAYGYINSNMHKLPTQVPNPNYRLIADQPSEYHKSFTLVNNKGGITLPTGMPTQPIVGGQLPVNNLNQVTQVNPIMQPTLTQTVQSYNNQTANLINPVNQNNNLLPNLNANVNDNNDIFIN